MTARNPTRFLLAALLFLPVACAPGDRLAEARVDDAVFRRAPDGLLERPELQAVAEAGLARDAAALREALADPDPSVRARAAFALGSVRSLGAGPELAGLISDDDPRVRADVAFALGQLPQLGGAEEQVAARLQVEDVRRVRDELIDALGHAAQPPGIQIVMTLGGDDLPAATRALARAFVRGVRPVGTVDTLVNRLTHPDAEVRQYAAWGIGRTEDILAWVDERIRIRNALAGLGQDDPAAMYLVQALGRRFDPISLPRVLERYRTGTDWRVRTNAVGAMENMGTGFAQADMVVAALSDPAPLVRLRAAQLIADMSPVEPWMQAAEERVGQPGVEPAVAGPLLTYLARTQRREAVLDWLAELDDDDAVRWGVSETALRELEGREAVEIASRGVASAEPGVSRVAARVLQARWTFSKAFDEIHDYFVEVLGTALRDALVVGDPETVATVVSALGDDELVEDGSVDVLTRRAAELPEGELREAVGDALRQAESGRVRALPDSWGWSPAARTTAPRAPVPAPDWDALRELGPRPRLVLDTRQGRVVAVLDTESAPLTVQTLSRVANAGRFDGVPFHRVIPNFVAQAGDLALGGDEGLGHAMRSELTRIRFGEAGDGGHRILGMARTAAFDTESTQFFITHSMQPHLDAAYTAFGEVVQGTDVVDRILPEDLIERMRIVPGR